MLALALWQKLVEGAWGWRRVTGNSVHLSAC
jgi:hypothetical protein